MFLRTSSLKRLNSFRVAENIPCCVQKNTSLKFHFVVCKQRDYHNIAKQYDGLSSLWAIRMYSPHVCLLYSRQICRPTSLYYISNCVFLFLCVSKRNSVPALKYQSRLCIARYSAFRRFRDAIHNTPELLEELKRLGYDERKRYFPPGQMAVIIKYLGEL